MNPFRSVLRYRKPHFAVIAAAIAIALGVAASGAGRAAAVERISEFTLENGVRMVVVPDHRVPVVTHMVWYAVGSAEEGPGEHGIAHYLEHMMFKGTPKYPKGAFDRLVASQGGMQNARTWNLGTMYWQRVPKSALARLMDMEADRMASLTIEDGDVASERAVVMEELRRLQVATGFDLGNLMRAALYEDHPEGRSPIGTAHSIAAFDGAKAQSFYNRYYGPARATVIVAGDVTEEEVRSLAATTFAAVPARNDLAPRAIGGPLEQGVSRRVQTAHERATTVSVYKTYLIPGAELGWRDQYTATLFAVAAGNGMTSRLFRRLVSEHGLATNVGCEFTLGGATGFSSLSCSVVARPGVASADIEAGFDATLAELSSGGLTDAEFDEVRSRFLASEPFRKDNLFDRADGLGGRITLGVPLFEADDQNTLVEDVTRADVERVGRTILTKARNVTGVLLPKEPAHAPAVSTAR